MIIARLLSKKLPIVFPVQGSLPADFLAILLVVLPPVLSAPLTVALSVAPRPSSTALDAILVVCAAGRNVTIGARLPCEILLQTLGASLSPGDDLHNVVTVIVMVGCGRE
ncbi:MAG: hypothetical protein ACJAZ5_000141 [Alloalcanivorax venustensis]|jgi:hypothetical protein